MKKGLLNAVSLVLAIINLVLTIVLVFSIVPTMKQTSELVSKAASILDLDVGNDPAGGNSSNVALTDLESVSVTFDDDKTTTVKLSSNDGKDHYIKLGVALNLNTKHEDYETMKDSVSSMMSLIDSIIIDVVSEYSYENCDKTAIQNAVLKRLQNEFGSSFIYSVTFSPFTVS